MYFRYITGAKKIIKKKDLYQRFRPFKLYWFTTYTSAFVNNGIGVAYASAFKSAGIGLLNYIDLKPIPALFRTLE